MNKHYETCPSCRKTWYIELDNDQERRLFEYHHKDQPIQEALSDLNAVEREFIKSGYCPDCQEMIFGNGETNKVKEKNYGR